MSHKHVQISEDELKPPKLILGDEEKVGKVITLYIYIYLLKIFQLLP